LVILDYVLRIVDPVLIDVSRLVYRRLAAQLPTGVDRVSLAYLRHFSGRARAVVSLGSFSSVLSNAESGLAFEALLDGRTQDRATAIRLIREALVRGLGGLRVADQVLLNTGHLGIEHNGYLVQLRRRGVRPVFMVHDLIPITHPEYCRPGEMERHVARIRNMITWGCGIITNSRDTLDTLTTFAGRNGLVLPPAVVASLAPGLAGWSAGPRPIVEPYFVMLGTIEPRKNHWMVLQIWRRLVESMGTSAPRLVLIGQRGWECENVVDLLERCQELNGVVIERTRCNDQELATYLQHAQALLFPSFVEGYGLPLAEALAHGVPVLASDLGVFREIAGEVPEYIDPLDGRRWMELIVDYANLVGSLRSAQMSRVANFQSTTWARHFEIVDSFLARLGAS